MKPEHTWACGTCGARVVATVGAIVAAFKAHAGQCPGPPRRPPHSAAPPLDRAAAAHGVPPAAVRQTQTNPEPRTAE